MKLMLPSVGSVKSTVPPIVRPIVAEVMVKFELTPFDVSTIAEAPELTDRLATVWFVPAPLLAPLITIDPPPRANAVFEEMSEPLGAKLNVNVPLPVLISDPPPLMPLPLMVVLPGPANVNALPFVLMPPVRDN